MKRDHNRLQLALALLGIATITVLAYYPGMSAGFYFDDEQNLLEAVALHWNEFSASNVIATLAASGRPALSGRTRAVGSEDARPLIQAVLPSRR